MWNIHKGNWDAAHVQAKAVVPMYTDPFTGYVTPAAKHRIVVDQFGKDIGAVTPRYHQLSNERFTAAVEVLAESEGLKLERLGSVYWGGRSRFLWTVPGMSVHVGRDSSPVLPWFMGSNDYSGKAAAAMQAILARERCSNGMFMGKVHEQTTTRRHTSYLDLEEWLRPVFRSMRDQAEVGQLMFDNMTRIPLSVSDRVFKGIAEETPARYVPKFEAAVDDYHGRLGETAYAAVQAVAEVGTHVFRGSAGIGWSQKQTQRIVDVAKEISGQHELAFLS